MNMAPGLPFSQVIIAFVSTSLVNLSLCFIGHTLSICRGYENNEIDCWVSHYLPKIPFLRVGKERAAFWRPVTERLVLLLSDYQLLFGVAILIAGFWKHCSISVYHFSMVVDLAWYSSTHMISLSVLKCYLRERPTLRNWRVCIMVLMLIMMLVAIGLASNPYWGASTSCPAQCLFDQPERNFKLTYPYMLALVLHYGTSIWRVFDTSYLDRFLRQMPRARLHDIEKDLMLSGSTLSSGDVLERQISAVFFFPFRILGILSIRLYLAIAAMLGSLTISLYYDILWFAFGLAGILRNREIPGSMTDGDENRLSFGQIVPILLLASIVLTFKEVYTGKQVIPLFLSCGYR